ncbi:Rab3 GTPase-activating protein catalytic subunit [Globodera pallida]|nr:Rab3 GTPase-activating protein catalytic subunit [Globodera pallida]
MGSSYCSRDSNDIISGDCVFEINDFTVVTEFEVFTLMLENAIQEMKTEADLPDIEIESSSGTRQRGVLSKKFAYQNYELQMVYVRQKNKMPTFSEDFLEHRSYLCEAAFALDHSDNHFFEDIIIGKQYGILSDFFLICAIGQNNFMTESTVNIINSAIILASSNIDCALPIFFQFAPGAAVGVLQNRNFFTNFEGAVLNNCLSSQKYLDGVIKMFKEKINTPSELEKIKISLQQDFDVNLSPFSEADVSSSPLGSSLAEVHQDQSVPIGCNCPHKYPFQPVGLSLAHGLRMAAVWVDIDEYLMVETDNFTNIEPQTAQRWKCSMLFDDEYSYEQSYLFTRLFELSEEELSECSVRSQLLSPSDQSSSLGTTALGPLADKPSVRDIKILGNSSPISQKSCSDCISFILKGSGNDTDFLVGHPTSGQQQFQKLLNPKSAPANSLTRRLAVCLVEKIDGNFVNFCRLWIKFLEILRHHWEYNLDLPYFDTDERPQLACCLLHQKLQMIQYCISVKKRKHREMEACEATTSECVKDPTNRITADEEFFDANESFDEVDAALFLKEPRGRSHPLDSNECLRNYPKERIFVPFTQDEGPMTEDQIEQRVSYLFSLEDANLRTRAQSELLLSDMQAFKAANPGCELVDFLRWHSPRDLSEEGELSERMKLPGNFWQETWDSANAVPAAQQQRLFNETREVEQIFQFFMNIRIRELVKLLLPVVSVHMAEILLENAAECLEMVGPKLEKLCNELNVATKGSDMDAYFDVARTLRMVEEMVMKYSTTSNLMLRQAQSMDLLKHIDLNVLKTFVTTLCESSSDVVDELSLQSVQLSCEIPDAPDGPIFGTLRSFFLMDEEGDREGEEEQWPRPIRKQAILRCFVPHPGNGSRAMPQRMYTSYREGEFIFCGSFTSDITFL